MSRADLFGYGAAGLMLAGVLLALLLIGGRRRPARSGASRSRGPRGDGDGEGDRGDVGERLARVERALSEGRGAARASAGDGGELERRVAALEAQAAGPGQGGAGGPGALPRAQNPGMSRQETALLAAVNRAWERAPDDRAGYERLAQGLGLPVRFFALRNIERSLQTLWDDTFTFVPSQDEGGWLLCEDEAGVLALPADAAFFRFAGVMTLARRMFDGVPPPSGTPDPRFVRAYRACRLRLVEPDRYKLLDRGLLLLGGEEDGGWARPLTYEALRGPGGEAGGLEDRVAALEERVEGLQHELAELAARGAGRRGDQSPGSGSGRGPLGEADLARLALELAKLAARR